MQDLHHLQHFVCRTWGILYAGLGAFCMQDLGHFVCRTWGILYAGLAAFVTFSWILNAANAASLAYKMLQMPQALHTKYCKFRKSCIQYATSPAYKMPQVLHTKCRKSCIQNAASPAYIMLQMPQVLHTKCCKCHKL
jgi:hypothetical protein